LDGLPQQVRGRGRHSYRLTAEPWTHGPITEIVKEFHHIEFPEIFRLAPIVYRLPLPTTPTARATREPCRPTNSPPNAPSAFAASTNNPTSSPSSSAIGPRPDGPGRTDPQTNPTTNPFQTPNSLKTRRRQLPNEKNKNSAAFGAAHRHHALPRPRKPDATPCSPQIPRAIPRAVNFPCPSRIPRHGLSTPTPLKISPTLPLTNNRNLQYNNRTLQ
jgi:hypothetical protein